MAFENVDMEDVNGGEAATPPPEESGNRTFLIVAGILGAIMILTLICIVAFAVFYLPRTQAAKKTDDAKRFAQNTVVALSVAQTEAAAKNTPTFTATKASAITPTATQSPTPTNTQVVAKAATNTATSVIDPRTPTAAALLTQAAIAAKTMIPTSTLLPPGGFADEVGMPVLLIIAALLVVVIFMARRLRTAH